MISIVETLIPKIERAIELGKINRMSIENGPTGVDSSYKEGLKTIFENIKNSDAEKDLNNYLNTFSDNELMLTQTIMYIGRDENEESLREESIESLLYSVMGILKFELDTEIDRNLEIMQMTGKAPFDQYLARGLAILESLK